MSKSLLKLIEYSLMPAALLILSKLAGVFVGIQIFRAAISTKEYANRLFSSVPLANPVDLLNVTSLSDILMYTVVATYFSIVLAQAVFLHSSHIKPPLAAHLAQRNLLGLVRNSYELYHSAFVSLVFLWLATILSIVNVLNGYSYVWVGVIALFATLVLTLGLLYDVYKEIELIRKSPGKYEWI